MTTNDTYTTIFTVNTPTRAALRVCATVEGGELVALESDGQPVGDIEAWEGAEALLQAMPADEPVAEAEGVWLVYIYAGTGRKGLCGDCATARGFKVQSFGGTPSRSCCDCGGFVDGRGVLVRPAA